MSDNVKSYQAEPPADLERKILDSTVPKNVREWWAAREIERLRNDNALLDTAITEACKDRDYYESKEREARAESDRLREVAVLREQEVAAVRARAVEYHYSLVEARAEIERLRARIAGAPSLATYVTVEDRYLQAKREAATNNVARVQAEKERDEAQRERGNEVECHAFTTAKLIRTQVERDEAVALLRTCRVLMDEATALMVVESLGGAFVPGGWSDCKARLDTFLAGRKP